MKPKIILNFKKDYTILNFSKPPVNSFCIDSLKLLIKNIDKTNPDKALVITCNGTIFSAGIDLFLIEKITKADFKYLISLFEELIQKIISHPSLTFTILNGHAIGGGFILASSTDFILSKNGNHKIGLNPDLSNISLPALPSAILKLKYKKKVNKLLSKNTVNNFIITNSHIKKTTKPFQYIKAELNKNDHFYLKRKNTLLEKLTSYNKANNEKDNNFFFKEWWSKESIESRKNVLIKLRSKI